MQAYILVSIQAQDMNPQCLAISRARWARPAHRGWLVEVSTFQARVSRLLTKTYGRRLCYDTTPSASESGGSSSVPSRQGRSTGGRRRDTMTWLICSLVDVSASHAAGQRDRYLWDAHWRGRWISRPHAPVLYPQESPNTIASMSPRRGVFQRRLRHYGLCADAAHRLPSWATLRHGHCAGCNPGGLRHEPSRQLFDLILSVVILSLPRSSSFARPPRCTRAPTALWIDIPFTDAKGVDYDYTFSLHAAWVSVS